jgi:cysteine dioxygenase
MEIMERISIGISSGGSLLDYMVELSNIELSDKIEYSSKKYTRKVIYIDDNIEVVVIGWDKGQSSTIHDHPSNGCIYRILCGDMVEYRYNSKLNIESMVKLNNGDIGNIMDNRYYHKMSNESGGRASSLHIYSPPNYKMNIYGK